MNRAIKSFTFVFLFTAFASNTFAGDKEDAEAIFHKTWEAFNSAAVQSIPDRWGVEIRR